MSPRIRLTAFVAGFLFLVAAGNSFVAGQEIAVQRFGDWTVTIQPAGSTAAVLIPPSPSPFRLIAQAEVVPAPPSPPEDAAAQVEDTAKPASEKPASETAAAKTEPLALVSRYAEVYNAIPFSRAEFNANPSYRHDATMEFLFGEMRQTVVYRTGGGDSGGNRGYGGYGYPFLYGGYGFNSFYPYNYGYGGGWGYNYFVRPYFLW